MKGGIAHGVTRTDYAVGIKLADIKKIFTSNGVLDTTMYDTFVKKLDIEKVYMTEGDFLKKKSKDDWYSEKYDVSLSDSGDKMYWLMASHPDKSDEVDTNFYWSSLLDDMIVLKGASNTSSGVEVIGSGKPTRLLSDLATYFRYNAYNKELRTDNKTGVKDGDNMQVQNMIMYAILVAQSLILFIAYIKRLFYVILLAMLAPIVVVIDFFNKFGN